LHLQNGPVLKKLTAFPFTIGRESLPSGLTLEDKSVSSRHAVMDLQDDMLTITDTNSRNGVKINDNVITPGVSTPINIGDTLVVGRTMITVADFSEDNFEEETPPHAGTEFISQHTVFINPDEQPIHQAQGGSPPNLVYQTPPAPAYQEKQQPAMPTPQAPVAPMQGNMQSSGLVCNTCGFTNKADDKFCGDCGAPMAAPAYPAPQAAPKKFCKKCGTRNDSMGKFCLTCGNGLV